MHERCCHYKLRIFAQQFHFFKLEMDTYLAQNFEQGRNYEVGSEIFLPNMVI